MTLRNAQVASKTPIATGLLVVHSCPQEAVSLVEWALAREIGAVVKLDWSPQLLLPGMLKTSVEWAGPEGTAAALTSSLFGQRNVRFEITEEIAPHAGGGRWMHTPKLGVFHIQTDAVGNGMLTEHVVRAAIAQSMPNQAKLAEVLHRALGGPWDAELEPFRAPEEAPNSIFLTAS